MVTLSTRVSEALGALPGGAGVGEGAFPLLAVVCAWPPPGWGIRLIGRLDVGLVAGMEAR